MKRLSTVLIVGLLISLTAFGGIFDFLKGSPKKREVKLAYVEWACATASAHVMKAAIEDRLGYEVTLTPVSAAAMWQAVASGDQDGMTTAWLPTTHGDFYDKFENDVEDLGPNYEGAALGLVVPEYVTIDSIPEIAENSEKFDGEIIGIDPGAGMMSATENAINDNVSGLGSIELVAGSGATMTASLADAIRKKEWIVVTGWKPHWKFARWDLKLLDDPDGVFGAEETINTVVRNGLKKDMPLVYTALDNFYWTDAQIGEVMDWNTKDNADPVDTGKKWVKENPDVVDGWFNK